MPYKEISNRYSIPSDNTTIIRYFEDYKFFWFLEKSALYFSSVGKFHKYDELLFSIFDKQCIKRKYQKTLDPEWKKNYLNRINSYEFYKKVTFINCWREGTIESRFLWDNFVKHGNGIAIKTTVKQLKLELEKSPFNIYVTKIHYFDPISEPLGIINTIRMFCRKMKDFRIENEIRAIIQLNKHDNIPENIEVSLNLTKLIDEIILGPKVSTVFTKKTEKFLQQLNLIDKLKESKIKYA